MFADTAGTVRDTGVSLAMTSRLYYASLAFVGAFGTAAVYWLGARAVINGTLTVGSLVALAQYVGRLYSPLTDLASARVDLLGALVSFERCFEILDAPMAIADAPDATRAGRLPRRSRVRQRRVPLPGAVDVLGRVARGRRRDAAVGGAVRRDPPRRVVPRRARARSSRWSVRRARARPRWPT